MMSKVISVINQKGGVGKTSTCIALNAGLQKSGAKTLLIDLDAQGNLSYAVNADTSEYNALRVLQRPEKVLDEIKGSKQGDIIASTPTLTNAEAVITEVGKEYRLKEAINHISNEYDYIIIDTPPALSILTINALTASDYVIIPAQADVFSLQGIAQLNQTIETVKKYTNPKLNVLGILLCRHNPRTNLTQHLTALIEDTANALNTTVFNSKIREAVAVKESQAFQSNIFEYAKNSNVAEDYQAFVDEVLDRIKHA